MSYIPILDFSPLSGEEIPSEEDWKDMVGNIYKGLSEVGFVYIVNHGVDIDKIEKSFAESKAFYELPTDIKLKYTKDISTLYFCDGYTPINTEKLNSTSTYEVRESFDFPVEIPEGETIITNARIVSEVPDFTRSLFDLRRACTPLVHKILKLFARAVQEDEDFFVNLSKGLIDGNIPSYTTFRTLYYPKMPEELKIEPGVVRCAEHTDCGILTLLFQDDIGGLEVKTVHNTWVPANPIPNSILINTGDLLELWSGGLFPATVHRVLIPEIEGKKPIPRQSIAYFIHPDTNVIVSPLKCAKSTAFEPINAYDHAQKKILTSFSHSSPSRF